LEPVGFLLTKSYSCPLVNLALRHQVLHSANWRAGICFFASLFVCLGLFGEKFCRFVYIRLLLHSDFYVGAEFLNLKKVIELQTMSDEIGNFLKLVKRIFGVVQNHDLEDIVEMALN